MHISYECVIAKTKIKSKFQSGEVKYILNLKLTCIFSHE